MALADPITGEVDKDSSNSKVKLAYFKSIPSQSKVYNKVLVQQSWHKKKLNFKKAMKELQAAS